ncbi:glutamate ABC transporter substrate-binding protein [Pseudonocardia sp. H11422]|uniref:glutamate ABC transporter substrate-binding protein n=1 Tax=Pseudonocardia sp. H11422 TaxID=2835866 RepID=UPI002931F243|nr:glutamate ABC transporter substrate-binding protein [Pseudonocardia sp. H11422]
MKLRTLAVGLMVSALALTACGREGSPSEGPAVEQPVAENVQVAGSPTFQKMTERGRVVIGVKNDQPGLGQFDPTTNTYSGFDIEIARLVAAQLGFSADQIDYVVVQSAAREDAISRGDVDYYVGTYTINDNRKQRVGFAGPYFIAGQDLLVRASDTDITGPETLNGKRVCSVTGSTPIQRVREEGLTQNIVEFQTYTLCVDQLVQGQVDAVTTDDAILKGYAAQQPDQLKVVGKTFSEEPYGIGVPRDDVALRNKINDILQAAHDDGTWQRIYDETLGKSGSPASPPAIDRY